MPLPFNIQKLSPPFPKGSKSYRVEKISNGYPSTFGGFRTEAYIFSSSIVSARILWFMSIAKVRGLKNRSRGIFRKNKNESSIGWPIWRRFRRCYDVTSWGFFWSRVRGIFSVSCGVGLRGIM